MPPPSLLSDGNEEADDDVDHPDGPLLTPRPPDDKMTKTPHPPHTNGGDACGDYVREVQSLPTSPSSEDASSSSATESSSRGPVDDSNGSNSVASPSNGDAPDVSGFNLRGYRDHLPSGEVDVRHDRGDDHFSTVTVKDSPEYDLTEGKRLAIVLNHEEFHLSSQPTRRGTKHDCQAIRATFKTLGFEVRTFHDLTFSDISKVIVDVQGESDLACLVLFILTHGEENGILHAADMPYKLDRDVINQLTPSCCKSLAGKPKLIFVQACQGQGTDKGAEVRVRSRHTSTDAPSGCSFRIPHFSDFLVFQAAYHGHYSFRSGGSGSWLVQALCCKLSESKEDDSILSILTDVKRYVALYRESRVTDPDHPELDRNKQIPLVQDTLIRNLYLKKKSYYNGDHVHESRHATDGRSQKADLPSNASTPVKKQESKAKGCSMM